MLSRAACVGFSVLALSWVLRKVDVRSLAQTLVSARPGWIVAAWTVFGIAYLLAAARWHLVLRLGRCQVHGVATARTVFVGHLFNTILFGPAGGDIAKAALYARWHGFSTSQILATCVLDRVLGGIGFFLVASCAPGFAIYGGRWFDRASAFLRSPRFAAVAVAAVLMFIGLHWVRRRWRWASPLERIASHSWRHGTDLLRNPRASLQGVLFSVLSHLSISCVFLFSLKAVTHADYSLAAIFWIFPVISLVTSAPVTFAGAGLREGAALFFLGLYHIPPDDAVAASLLVLFTYLVWALISGFILWRRDIQVGSVRPAPKTISVVIPTRNEAEALPETIARVRRLPEITEIIVADGGSTDATVALAEQLGCRVVTGATGRGPQLRLGAEHARGDVVLLLHADTWLPPEAGHAVLNCLRDSAVVGGGFWKVFREKNPLMAGSRARCGLRLLLFRRIMGDQGMFVRRETLARIGGVPPMPLMEEFELCRKLTRHGTLALASATVTTSARRFRKLGVLRTYLRMWHVTARYYLGTPAQELQQLYERD